MVIGVGFGVFSSYVFKHLNLPNFSTARRSSVQLVFHEDAGPSSGASSDSKPKGWIESLLTCGSDEAVEAKSAVAEPATSGETVSKLVPESKPHFGLVDAALEEHHEEEDEPAEERFLEAALTFTFPWAAYFSAEALSLSGIVAILFCGIVMAKLTRENYTKSAKALTHDAYKTFAKVAETYVFIYLGMATVAFPIFSHTVTFLILIAIAACFVGRLHIYVGSWLTNSFREPGGSLPPISNLYMFVMWFSGLRGGVAFALAANSYAQKDFPACGFKDVCTGEKGEMTDSLAILQTTMIIAVFTIVVFGGAITDVAVKCDVLEPKGSKERKATYHIPGLLEMFTHKKVKKPATIEMI